MRSNYYWNVAGPVQFLGKSLQEWQAAGHDAGSRVADPLFENPGARDFRLRPGSPALEIGFQPFDAKRAGVLGEEWRAKAAEIRYPPLVIAPEPPAVSLGDTPKP
jgi:hypothetical protein